MSQKQPSKPPKRARPFLHVKTSGAIGDLQKLVQRTQEAIDTGVRLALERGADEVRGRTVASLPPTLKPDGYGEVDRERFYAAFVQWEAGYRVNPEAYATPEQTAAMGLDKASSERADYFLALLNGQGEPA